MRALIYRFIDERAGATAIEYSLIAAFIGIVLVAVLQNVGTDTPIARAASRGRSDCWMVFCI